MAAGITEKKQEQIFEDLVNNVWDCYQSLVSKLNVQHSLLQQLLQIMINTNDKHKPNPNTNPNSDFNH